MRLKNLIPLPFLCLASGAIAQEFPVSGEPDSLVSKRMATAPTIDGTLGADEWTGAATSKRGLVVISSAQASGDRLQYWIGYDEKYVYVATRIMLDNGGKINSDEFRQNVSLQGNDSVSLLLDPIGNSQQWNLFSYNASGATQMQIAGGRAAKQEWLGQFDAAGRITDDGWEGEARIAWDLMPMPSEGVRDMKFIFDMYVSSKQQSVSTHSVQGNMSRTHTMTGVDVPKIDQSRKINLLPYTYVGFDDNGDYIANAGLDVKTALTNDLNFVTTVNPDFRNIENDILSLDFSNFERLADETRPFFVEGSQFLNTGMVGQRNIFAPQRIGSFDTGFNVYGNISDNMQLGALATIDQGGQHTVATKLGYRLSPTQDFRFSFAALDRANEDNYSGSLGYLGFSGDYLLFAEASQTDDEITGIGNALAFGTQYRAGGLQVLAIREQISPDYNPRIGFAPETDFNGTTGRIQYQQSYTNGLFRSTSFVVTGIDQDRFDGGHYRELVTSRAELYLRSGARISINGTADHFEDRHDEIYSMSFSNPFGNSNRVWAFGLVTGHIANQRYNSKSVLFRYRPVKRLQLFARYQKVNFFTESDQTVFSFNWEMDKWQSVGGRVVGSDDEWNWFASYSMRGNLGAEYFLIVGDPNADSFQSSMILKVSMPFTIG